MKSIVLCVLVVVLLCAVQPAIAFDNHWYKQDTLSKPFHEDRYGPGVNSDATGRPFKWQTQDGEDLPPNTRVKPDGYGPGIGMDQYGRPVKARPW